jgi:hypothetical protein
MSLFVLFLATILLGLACSLLASPLMVTVLGGLIRIFNSFSFTLKSLYIQELFDPTFRAQASGIILSFGLLGGALVPPALLFCKEIGVNELVGVSAIALMTLPAVIFLK